MKFSTKKKQGAYPYNFSGLLKTFLTAVIYFVAAKLSLFLAFEGTNATPVWPPTGIAFAAIFLFGYRVSPGILLGAFLANSLVLSEMGIVISTSISTALVTAIGNTLEAVVGVYLFKYFSKSDSPFTSIKNVLIFIGIGALFSTTISASDLPPKT